MEKRLFFSLFNEFEAKRIVSIPILFRLPEDKIIWHGEKDDLYSVRSAYHQVGEEKRRAQTGSSSGSNRSMWKEIWHITLPNCIKNFIWRLAKGILPTRENLVKKGIDTDVSCPLCNGNSETDDIFLCIVMLLRQCGLHPHMEFMYRKMLI